MSIYTGRGDDGRTSLGNGDRASKASLRLEAYGSVDEASAAIAFAQVVDEDATLSELLDFAEARLGNCAAALAGASADRPAISDEDISALERAIDRFEATTGPLKGFITLGGSEASARLHLARAAVRRAERRIAALNEAEPVDRLVLSFVNRLSDALFAAARYANHSAGVTETLWDAEKSAPGF